MSKKHPDISEREQELLKEILKEAPHSHEGVHAQRFRASHEDDLPLLDGLERKNLLSREQDKYVVKLSVIALLGEANRNSEQVIFLCNLLFNVLREEYKKNPGASITLNQLSVIADLPQEDITKALYYLIQAPIWAGRSTDFSESTSYIAPSEDILRYKKFSEILTMSENWIVFPLAPQLQFREKHQKFGVLDAPGLLNEDLKQPSGVLGIAVIFLDLDNFKSLNTKFTESVVDEVVLPPLFELFENLVSNLGYAYGEGGDEFTFLFPNASESIACVFGEELRHQIQELKLPPPCAEINLTASIGIAHAECGSDTSDLKKSANLAKNFAKENGKNCVALWKQPGCRIVKICLLKE